MVERPPKLKLAPTLLWSLVMGLIVGFGLAGLRSVNSDFSQIFWVGAGMVFYVSGMVGINHLKNTFAIWAAFCGPVLIVSQFLPIVSESARPAFYGVLASLGLAAMAVSLFLSRKRSTQNR